MEVLLSELRLSECLLPSDGCLGRVHPYDWTTEVSGYCVKENEAGKVSRNMVMEGRAV